MYELAFETSIREYPIKDIVPVLIAILLLIALYFWGIKPKINKDCSIFKAVSHDVGGIIMISVCILVVLCGTIGEFVLYKSEVQAYKNGNYSMVEGTVDNFIAATPDGKNTESFYVDSIKFEYLYGDGGFAYHRPSYKGGVIKAGEPVRIGYIDWFGESKIVCIELYQSNE